jgi:hypothetical protein
MLQEPVIIPLAVSDPMAGQIKGYTGDNDQVRFVSQMVISGRAGFQDAETSLRKTTEPLYLAEDHCVSAYGRIQDPFAGRERRLKNSCRVCLVMGRCIQGNTVRPRKLYERDQMALGHPARLMPLVVGERPTPCQYLLTE